MVGRRLRDLRGRVKVAWAAISAHPRAQAALRGDWRREAALYAQFGITQRQFPNGVAAAEEAVREPSQLVDGSVAAGLRDRN
jgi:hypothetical protein